MTEPKSVIFATEPVNTLLNEVGEACRDLFNAARRLTGETMGTITLHDQGRYRDLLYRFDRWKDSVGEFDISPKAGEPTGYVLIPEDTIWKRADQIRVGDVLDLEGDEIADPNGDHPAMESEYQTVLYVNHETPDCIVLGIDGIDHFGFPPGHLLKYLRHDGEHAVGVDYLTAHAYSDDHKFDVKFNAAEWFEQASDDEIRELARVGFGGDYEADVVAQFYSDDSSTLKDLFSYVAAVDDMGYECHVDAAAALGWLRQYRPALASELEVLATDLR